MRKSKGFTLIELVVVIAILGILAGIAIPRFMDAQATARGSKIVADMRTLESALELYRVNNTINGTPDISVLTNGNIKYMASIPVPPAGEAIFPNGNILTIKSTTKYILYNASTQGLVVVIDSTADGQMFSNIPLSLLIN
jgi:prepilin-type N-terminal cleavage/methylation domain-containing protein